MRIRGPGGGVLVYVVVSLVLGAVAGCSATTRGGASDVPSSTVAGPRSGSDPQPPASFSSAPRRSIFGSELNAELAERSGHVSASVLDITTGQAYGLGADAPVYTASIVKLPILASLLHQAESDGTPLSLTARHLVDLMIEQSDNAATTILWRQQGGSAGLQRLFDEVGMTETTPAPTILEPWDGVRTTARDQILLMRSLFDSTRILDHDDADYVLGEMAHVEPSQRWGITAGTSSTTHVSLKNGWLPLPGEGWTVNSIGEVRAGSHAYLIAILGSGAPSMSYGISSLELVARQAAAAFDA